MNVQISSLQRVEIIPPSNSRVEIFPPLKLQNSNQKFGLDKIQRKKT